MKILLKILGVISTIFIIAGIGLGIAGFVTGAKLNDLPYWNRVTSYRENDSDDLEYSGDAFVFDADQIKKLDIKMDINEIDIIPHEDSIIKVDGAQSDKIVVEQDGDTLKIKGKSNLFEKHKDVVTIYLPENFSFDQVKIDIGSGELSMSELNCKKGDISIGSGNVVVQEAKVEESLKLDVGMGNLTIAEAVFKDVNIDCGVGNVDLSIKGDVDNYNYDLKCGIGSIEIDAQEYSGLGTKKKIDNDTNRDIKIDCGTGNVVIYFE